MPAYRIFLVICTPKQLSAKFVIGKNKKEFAIIEKYGMVNLSEVQLMDMVKKYLCKSE